ncbi:uncharacterized protein BCR38DRAFT_432395 [Pseudomassariella vexata]|uniref:Stress response RCI peptide n=1 Tax=Pseudomassariella vexata TaxID=1141098 RepID=A0A1Y2E351_9PEZI|nr:uncharacterized protein BCR38DRAFT_432395 [Pseudomassariella vexata]ORY65295.1 hypothetical protein BCR38DRAFT_432395 [Pseudomassariella vexata]
MCSTDIFLGILAILFPPLAVWVKCGICSADSIINILLCMLGFLPGLLHAWYIIAKFPDCDQSYERVAQDVENGRVTYVFVNGQPQQQGGRGARQQQQPQQQQPKPVSPGQHGGMSYGTTANDDNEHRPSPTVAEAGSSSHGDSGRAPPSYAEAVQGDHKVQTKD